LLPKKPSFLVKLVTMVLKLESCMHCYDYKVHKTNEVFSGFSSSPFRGPLLKFINIHKDEALVYFLSKLSDPPHAELFQSLIAHPKATELRQMVGSKLGVFHLANSCFCQQLQCLIKHLPVNAIVGGGLGGSMAPATMGGAPNMMNNPPNMTGGGGGGQFNNNNNNINNNQLNNQNNDITIDTANSPRMTSTSPSPNHGMMPAGVGSGMSNFNNVNPNGLPSASSTSASTATSPMACLHFVDMEVPFVLSGEVLTSLACQVQGGDEELVVQGLMITHTLVEMDDT
jgi:hypothetical protein